MAEPGASSQGPPYLPTTEAVGGTPTPAVDDPICAVLISLYAIAGVFHLTVRLTQHEHHRSRLGFLLCIFSVVRILALVLRIAWASRRTDTNLAISAMVFTAAGVVILFVVNLIFVRRVLYDFVRGGQRRIFDWALRFLIFCVLASIVMLIVATVYSFFTLHPAARLACRKIQLFGATYLALLAFLPVPVTAVALFFRNEAARCDPAARRRFHAKVQLLLATATLLATGAGFRCGTSFDAVPLGHEKWFDSKAAFYCFDFAIEITVLYLFAIWRFNVRLRHRRPLDAVDAQSGIETAPVGAEKVVVGPSRWKKLAHDRELFGGGNWTG